MQAVLSCLQPSHSCSIMPVWSLCKPADDQCEIGVRKNVNSCVLSARLRSVRPERHGSEAVTLRHPVMPVANGLGRGLVGINGGQL